MSKNPIARFFISLTKPPQLPDDPREIANEDWRGARVSDSDFSGAHFQEVNLPYARLRGVNFINAEIWGAVSGLVINGIEVEPLIEAEIEKQYPGRATLWARDPDGVCAAWQTIEDVWGATVDRALQLPEEDLHVRMHGEWSFLETLRHLVMVDDGFIRYVRERDRPIYELGVPHTPVRSMFASVVDLDADPSAEEVLAARKARFTEVRDLVATLDADELGRVCQRTPLDAAGMDMPVLYCFWRMVNEEWEHHSFAVRDLEALEKSN